MSDTLLRWLHISDLHWGLHDSGTDPHSRMKKFFADLEALLKKLESKVIDLILFTGDLTQSGLSEQFASLDTEVIQQLRHLVGSEAVLLAVPGNHDLKWPDQKTSDYEVAKNLSRDPEARASLFSEQDGAHRKTVVSAFSAWTQWWKRSQPTGVASGLLPGDFLYTLERHGRRYGIAGVNSAATDLLGKAKEGQLTIDPRQLTAALSAEATLSRWRDEHDFCLLLSHHPPSWLDADSRDEGLYGGIDAHAFDLHLFGHMHAPIARSESVGGGQMFSHFQSPSLFGLETYQAIVNGEPKAGVDRRFGYTVGELLPGAKGLSLRLWPRRAEKAQDGNWRFGSDRSFHLADDFLSVDWCEFRGREVSASQSAAAPQPRATSWEEAVETSPLWAMLDARDDEVEAAKASCRAIAQRCESHWRAVSQKPDVVALDPWWDEHYAIRIIERLSALGPRSATSLQTQILLAAPLVAEAIRAEAVAWLVAQGEPETLAPVSSSSPPTARRLIEHIHRRHEAHVRRAQRLDAERRVACTRWLMHQALVRHEAIWEPENARGPAARVRDTLKKGGVEPVVVACLFRLAPYAGGGLNRLQGAFGPHQDRSLSDGEARLEPDLARLLVLAGALALDIRRVDDAAIDRGGESAVAIRDAVRQGQWEEAYETAFFAQECADQVTHFCVSQLVEHAGRVLDAVRDGTPPALGSRWPAAVSTVRLTAAVGPNGRALFTTPHVRFRLDHRRIRELLMGQRLYGDPRLAVRELYQNALDACRYRRARTVHLERRSEFFNEVYRGRIIFRQGEEDGRPYVECVDDGVGMSTMLVERVFAVAGQRFHDQSDFAREQRQWDPDVRFTPNSQHGIGVLSYFMLADELEIETREFDPRGDQGRPLRIRITSASGLFDMQEGRADQPTGSRVRLYLAHDSAAGRAGAEAEPQPERVSQAFDVVQTLKELLVVSEFDVEIRTEAGPVRRWQAGVPHPDWGRFWATGTPGLWWSDTQQPLLADGLVTREVFDFALIDLTGERYPKLSVDRWSVDHWDKDWVFDRLSEALPRLPEWSRASNHLLASVLSSNPRLVDRGWDLVRGSDRPLPLARVEDWEPSRVALMKTLLERWEPWMDEAHLDESAPRVPLPSTWSSPTLSAQHEARPLSTTGLYAGDFSRSTYDAHNPLAAVDAWRQRTWSWGSRVIAQNVRVDDQMLQESIGLRVEPYGLDRRREHMGRGILRRISSRPCTTCQELLGCLEPERLVLAFTSSEGESWEVALDAPPKAIWSDLQHRDLLAIIERGMEGSPRSGALDVDRLSLVLGSKVTDSDLSIEQTLNAAAQCIAKNGIPSVRLPSLPLFRGDVEHVCHSWEMLGYASAAKCIRVLHSIDVCESDNRCLRVWHALLRDWWEPSRPLRIDVVPLLTDHLSTRGYLSGPSPLKHWLKDGTLTGWSDTCHVLDALGDAVDVDRNALPTIESRVELCRGLSPTAVEFLVALPTTCLARLLVGGIDLIDGLTVTAGIVRLGLRASDARGILDELEECFQVSLRSPDPFSVFDQPYIQRALDLIVRQWTVAGLTHDHDLQPDRMLFRPLLMLSPSLEEARILCDAIGLPAPRSDDAVESLANFPLASWVDTRSRFASSRCMILTDERPWAVVRSLLDHADEVGLTKGPLLDKCQDLINRLAAELDDRTADAPYSDCEWSEIAWRWLAWAGELARQGHPAKMCVLFGGRKWAWWLSDEVLDELGRRLVEPVDHERTWFEENYAESIRADWRLGPTDPYEDDPIPF